MFAKKTVISSIVLLACLSSLSAAQQNKQLSCTGTVVDTKNQPIADAKVSLYKVGAILETMSYNFELAQEKTTKGDGAFSFTVDAESNTPMTGIIILAQKEGFAYGWANWTPTADVIVKIQLNQAITVSGVVVDEADKPVADAEVAISVMMVLRDGGPQLTLGQTLPGIFTTKTSTTGKFSFNRIPVDATMEFLVKKEGRAIVSTVDVEDITKLKFSAGQTDIKLVQPIGAKIEGTAVDKTTGKPAAGASIMASRGSGNQTVEVLFGPKPVVTGADGKFVIDGLLAADYTLQLVPYSAAFGEINEWICEPIAIKTELGKTQSGVKMELSKGGILEVVVTDAKTKKTVEQVSVSVQPQAGGTSTGALTNKDGIAQIRLAPGQYQISSVYKQGFARQSNLSNSIAIEDGKTVRIGYQLAGQPKITGIVTDQNNKPITEEVSLIICPMGNQHISSDSQGKFEINFDPSSWGSSVPVMYLVARYEKDNLATAVEIEENTRTINIKLKPAITITGRIVDTNDKGLGGVRISANLMESNWGSTIANAIISDAEGRFEVKAIPADQKYNIVITSAGYGQKNTGFNAEDAINNRLDIGKITLLPANLTVSGVVVDNTGKPVANVRVSVSGDNQPAQYDITTDVEGKFTAKACKGTIQISAYLNQGGSPTLFGNVSAEGGATDVRIVISSSSSTSSTQRQPLPLIGKQLPELKDLAIPSLPDTAGKMVLVCFFDYEQRPSRNCIMQLNTRAQELKTKGIELIIVQASKIDKAQLDKWLKENNISFPVGMLEKDEEQTRFSWGVKALPWLILTDKSHKVITEGFALSELDEKVKK
jgi:protocatechuate 3,4-dioxygenase beta subunit